MIDQTLTLNPIDATKEFRIARLAAGTLEIHVFVGKTEVNAKVVVDLNNFHAMGDANYDGVIDQADADLVSAAMNSMPGDAHWNPDCDFNGDGIVDVYDAATINANWGDTAVYVSTSPFTVDLEAGSYYLNIAYNKHRKTQVVSVVAGEVNIYDVVFAEEVPDWSWLVAGVIVGAIAYLLFFRD